MASGEVSAARTIISLTPRLRVLVASLAPLEGLYQQMYIDMPESCANVLLQLLVVGGLLDEVKNLLREIWRSQRVSSRSVSHCV